MRDLRQEGWLVWFAFMQRVSMEQIMIEIGEKCASGLHKVYESSEVAQQHLGDIVKTRTNMWLAIPRVKNISNPMTAHKLRRDAIAALS